MFLNLFMSVVSVVEILYNDMLLVTSQLYFEIGHGGSFYTTELVNTTYQDFIREPVLKPLPATLRTKTAV